MNCPSSQSLGSASVTWSGSRVPGHHHHRSRPGRATSWPWETRHAPMAPAPWHHDAPGGCSRWDLWGPTINSQGPMIHSSLVACLNIGNNTEHMWICKYIYIMYIYKNINVGIKWYKETNNTTHILLAIPWSYVFWWGRTYHSRRLRYGDNRDTNGRHICLLFLTSTSMVLGTCQ